MNRFGGWGIIKLQQYIMQLEDKHEVDLKIEKAKASVREKTLREALKTLLAFTENAGFKHGPVWRQANEALTTAQGGRVDGQADD